jgi:hypothetical protein
MSVTKSKTAPLCPEGSRCDGQPKFAAGCRVSGDVKSLAESIPPGEIAYAVGILSRAVVGLIVEVAVESLIEALIEKEVER